MSEYLQPNSPLTINQKQRMFALKNRMIEISENFPGKNMGSERHYGSEDSILHIYNCDLLNQGSPSNIKYENIFNGDIKDQVNVLNKFEEN